MHVRLFSSCQKNLHMVTDGSEAATDHEMGEEKVQI